LDRLYSGSRAYSEFGFRYSNWLEAKFFRSGSGTPPSTQNLGTVVADLIRLIALVPIELAKDKDGDDTKYTVTGRYLLHAYFGKPLNHLNPTRKAKGSKPREWVEPLLRPGQVTIDDFELSDETDAFFKHLGHGFRDATIKVNLTNIVLSPIKPPKDNFYTVVLSRIDSASFSLGGQSLKLNADRTVEFTSKTELDQMRLNVASTLKPAKSEKDTAIEDEEDADQ